MAIYSSQIKIDFHLSLPTLLEHLTLGLRHCLIRIISAKKVLKGTGEHKLKLSLRGKIREFLFPQA